MRWRTGYRLDIGFEVEDRAARAYRMYIWDILPLLTLSPTCTDGGADNRPPEISKTQQGRDKRQAALHTADKLYNVLFKLFLDQVKNDVTGVKSQNGGT